MASPHARRISTAPPARTRPGRGLIPPVRYTSNPSPRTDDTGPTSQEIKHSYNRLESPLGSMRAQAPVPTLAEKVRAGLRNIANIPVNLYENTVGLPGALYENRKSFN